MHISRLSILEERYQRNLLLARSPEAKDFHWLKAGLAGELEVFYWLQNSLSDRARLIHDLSVDYKGQTQIDILVMWDKHWWLIEVKNYQGFFESKYHISYIDDESIRTDVLGSMRRRIRIVTELAQSIHSSLTVSASLVLIHPQCDYRIDEAVDFDIVTRNQFDRLINKKLSLGYNYNPQMIDRQLERIARYKFSYPEELPVMTDSDWDRCYKGVRCPDCQQYLKEKSKRSLFCSRCKKIYPKSDLVFSLYKQLCCLYFDHECIATGPKLAQFSGGLISRSTITRVLSKKINHVERAQMSYYENMYFQKKK